MPGFKDRLVGAGYAFGWTVICRMPESWMAATFNLAADIAWRRQGPRVRVLEANLRRVLGPEATGPQVRAMSRLSMRSYARYWLEVFRLPVMPIQRLMEGMAEFGCVDLVLATLAAGRGVVIALPHMGNWDQAGAWIINKGAGSFTTVMERLEPESVYRRFLEFREGLGMEVLAATGGPHPFGVLAQRLRAGKLVNLPTDRDVTGSGIEVDFFGEKALMMGGPAALAVQTGALLVPASIWFTEGGWGVHLYDPIPVPADGDRRAKVAAMTQRLASVFEAGIREHPQDWHMLQRVFVADLDPERLTLARVRAQARSAKTQPQTQINGENGSSGQSAPDRLTGVPAASQSQAEAGPTSPSQAGEE